MATDTTTERPETATRSTARFEPTLDAGIPDGPLEQKWDTQRFRMKLVNPANKRRYSIIVVGSGLAGASAAASFAELGYNVKCFCYQDSPRRAHSIAAQGGINAAKNYRNDGDSIYRLFYDTVKGGDYRAREANVYRLAQLSVNIIDQCVAQGVPFAREYGGLLDNRSFGGAQVSRTFYARGQTGQQLLLGAYQALSRSIASGGVRMYPRTEMLDLVVSDGHARGIITRDMVTGKIEAHAGDAVVLATGGYGNVFLSFHQRQGLQYNGDLARLSQGRPVRQSVLYPDPPDLHPGQRRPPIEADPDERIAAQRRAHLGAQTGRRYAARPTRFPKPSATTIWSSATRASATWCRAMWPRAPRKPCATKAAGLVRADWVSTSTSRDAIKRLGEDRIRERYGNLFDMYERITGENPYERADAHLSGHPLHDGRPVGRL